MVRNTTNSRYWLISRKRIVKHWWNMFHIYSNLMLCSADIRCTAPKQFIAKFNVKCIHKSRQCYIAANRARDRDYRSNVAAWYSVRYTGQGALSHQKHHITSHHKLSHTRPILPFFVLLVSQRPHRSKPNTPETNKNPLWLP